MPSYDNETALTGSVILLLLLAAPKSECTDVAEDGHKKIRWYCQYDHDEDDVSGFILWLYAVVCFTCVIAACTA